MCMWTHTSKKLEFCLCVDNFGLKYYKQTICTTNRRQPRNKYKYTVEWLENYFCGLKFDWECTKGYVDIYIYHYTL